MLGAAFVTIKGPEWGLHGEFLWAVELFLTQGTALKPAQLAEESWIIQHIVISEEGAECNGNAIEPKHLDYYEAWRVGTDGHALKKYQYDFDGDGKLEDVDLTANRPPGLADVDDVLLNSGNPQTKGKFTIDGTLHVLDKIEPGVFKLQTSRDGAGLLPRSTTAPRGLSEPSLTRHVQCIWEACDIEKVTGKATAENRGRTLTAGWEFSGQHQDPVAGT